MIAPWSPVVITDSVGSVLTLLVAIWCLVLARKWARRRADDIFCQYVFLLTLSIVCFAGSRSIGHLIKQLLLFSGQVEIWQELAPLSGAINTATFVVVFAFGIYFHRFQKIHLEMESYKEDLEEKVVLRTEELEEARLTLENVLNNSNPICITNIEFDVVMANKAYEAIWGQVGEAAQPRKCYDSRPGPNCHGKDCPLTLIISGRDEVSIEMVKTVGDRKMEFIATARPFPNKQGELIGMVESFQDISARKDAERKMEELAFYDPLTRMPNRRFFKERLMHELSRAKRNQHNVGLMFLDLDRFKYVNDTLGHSAGDKLLQEVAKRLRATVRASDTIARMGGDEFTIILPEVATRQSLADLAEKLLEVVRQPVTIGVQDVAVGVSIGIAVFPEDGINIEKLMKNVDLAMYESKNQGRNRFNFYTPAQELAEPEAAVVARELGG